MSFAPYVRSRNQKAIKAAINLRKRGEHVLRFSCNQAMTPAMPEKIDVFMGQGRDIGKVRIVPGGTVKVSKIGRDSSQRGFMLYGLVARDAESVTARRCYFTEGEGGLIEITLPKEIVDYLEMEGEV